MEFKDTNAVDNAEAGFYFELHFHYLKVAYRVQ